MAKQKINEHVISLSVLLNTKVDQNQLEGTVRQLKAKLSNLSAEMDKKKTQQEAQKIVDEINSAFKELHMPEITFDDLQNNLKGIKQQIINAFKQTNGISADLFSLSDIEESLKNIDRNVNSLTQHMQNLSKASDKASGFARSLSEINSAAALLTAAKLDISDVFNFGEDMTDVDAMAKALRTLNNAVRNMVDNPSGNWAKDYATTVKFVKLYERASQLPDFDQSIITKPMTNRYNMAKIGIAEKENILRNVYNAQLGRDISTTGKPSEGNWATESTVQDIRDILKKGITVSGRVPQGTTSKATESKPTETRREVTSEDFKNKKFTFYRGLEKGIIPEYKDAKSFYYYLTTVETQKNSKVALNTAAEYGRDGDESIIQSGTFVPRNPFVINGGGEQWYEFGKFKELVPILLQHEDQLRSANPDKVSVVNALIDAAQNQKSLSKYKRRDAMQSMILQLLQSLQYDAVIFDNILDKSSEIKGTPTTTAAILNRSAITIDQHYQKQDDAIKASQSVPDWTFPYLNQQEINQLDLTNPEQIFEALKALDQSFKAIDNTTAMLGALEQSAKDRGWTKKKLHDNASWQEYDTLKTSWSDLQKDLLERLLSISKSTEWSNILKSTNGDIFSAGSQFYKEHESEFQAPQYEPISTPSFIDYTAQNPQEEMPAIQQAVEDGVREALTQESEPDSAAQKIDATVLQPLIDQLGAALQNVVGQPTIDIDQSIPVDLKNAFDKIIQVLHSVQQDLLQYESSFQDITSPTNGLAELFTTIQTNLDALAQTVTQLSERYTNADREYKTVRDAMDSLEMHKNMKPVLLDNATIQNNIASLQDLINSKAPLSELERARDTAFADYTSFMSKILGIQTTSAPSETQTVTIDTTATNDKLDSITSYLSRVESNVTSIEQLLMSAGDNVTSPLSQLCESVNILVDQVQSLNQTYREAPADVDDDDDDLEIQEQHNDQKTNSNLYKDNPLGFILSDVLKSPDFANAILSYIKTGEADVRQVIKSMFDDISDELIDKLFTEIPNALHQNDVSLGTSRDYVEANYPDVYKFLDTHVRSPRMTSIEMAKGIFEDDTLRQLNIVGAFSRNNIGRLINDIKDGQSLAEIVMQISSYISGMTEYLDGLLPNLEKFTDEDLLGALQDRYNVDFTGNKGMLYDGDESYNADSYDDDDSYEYNTGELERILNKLDASLNAWTLNHISDRSDNVNVNAIRGTVEHIHDTLEDLYQWLQSDLNLTNALQQIASKLNDLARSKNQSNSNYEPTYLIELRANLDQLTSAIYSLHNTPEMEPWALEVTLQSLVGKVDTLIGDMETVSNNNESSSFAELRSTLDELTRALYLLNKGKALTQQQVKAAITDALQQVNSKFTADDVKATVDVQPIVGLLQEISGKLTSGVKLSNGSGTSSNGSNDAAAEDGKPKSKSKAKQGTINRGTAKGQTSLQRVVDYYYWLEEQAKAYEKNKPYVDAIQSVQQELLSDMGKFNKKNEKPIVEYLRGETDTVPDVKWFQNLQSKHNLNMTRMAGQDDINSQNAIRKQALDLLRQEYKIRSDISTLERNGAKKDSLSVLQREIKDLSTLRQTLFSMLDADQQRLYIDEQIALTGKQHADDVRRQVKQAQSELEASSKQLNSLYENLGKLYAQRTHVADTTGVDAEIKQINEQIASIIKKQPTLKEAGKANIGVGTTKQNATYNNQIINANNNQLRQLYAQQAKLESDKAHNHEAELAWYADEIKRRETISKLDQDEIDRIKQKVAARAAGKKADEEEKQRKAQEAADRKQQYEEEIAWQQYRLEAERQIRQETEKAWEKHQQQQYNIPVDGQGRVDSAYFVDQTARDYLNGGRDVDDVRSKIENYRDELAAAGKLTDELREKIDLLFVDLNTSNSSGDIDQIFARLNALKEVVKIQGIEKRTRDADAAAQKREQTQRQKEEEEMYKIYRDEAKKQSEIERGLNQHRQPEYNLSTDANGWADNEHFVDNAARAYLDGGYDINDIETSIKNYMAELDAANKLTDQLRNEFNIMLSNLALSYSDEDITSVVNSFDTMKESIKIGNIEQRRNPVEALQRQISQYTEELLASDRLSETFFNELATMSVNADAAKGDRDLSAVQEQLNALKKKVQLEQTLEQLYRERGSLDAQRQNMEANGKDVSGINEKIKANEREIQTTRELIKVGQMAKDEFDELNQRLTQAQESGRIIKQAEYNNKQKAKSQPKTQRDENTQKKNELKSLYAQLARNRYDGNSTAVVATQNEIDNLEREVQLSEEEKSNIQQIAEARARISAARKTDTKAAHQAEAEANKEEKRQLTELLKLYKEKAKIEMRIKQIGNDASHAAEKEMLEQQIIAINSNIDANPAKTTKNSKATNDAYDDAKAQAVKDLNKSARLKTHQGTIDKYATMQRQLIDAANNVGIDNVADNNLITQFSTYLYQYQQLKNQLDAKSQKGEIVTEEELRRLQDAKRNVEQYKTAIQHLYDDTVLGQNQSNIDLTSFNGRFDFSASNMDSYKTQLVDLMKALTRGKGQVQSFDHETNTLTYTIQNGAHETQTMTLHIRDLDHGITQTARDTRYSASLFDNLRQKMREISRYVIGYSTISRLVQEVRRGLQYVKEIDAAMTELKKVTNETDETYAKFMQDARKTAERVGATTKDIISSTADWARLGYSIQEAAKLSESTQVLLNVSEFTDVSKATDSLISSVQAFGYTADQSMHVVDILNEIGNNYAISTADLAQSLTKSSGALVTAGGDLAEAAALTATANSIIQDADVVGTALKTTSLRLRGTDVKVLDEEGLDSDNVVTSKSKLRSKVKALSGVDILTDAGAYKSTYQILLEISKVWEDIDNMDQAALLELISGKRNASVISALLQAPETLEKAYESAQNASGSAEKENERYLDSIQGRITLFQSAMQNFWTKLISADVVKRIVDLGTTLVKFIDTGTGKVTALLLYIDSKITKIAPKILSIINPLKALDRAGQNFRDVMSGVVTTISKVNRFNIYEALTRGTDLDWEHVNDLSQALADAADSSGRLNIQQATNILLTKGYTREQSEAILSTLGFTTANQALTFSFKNLGKATLAALKVLWPFIVVGAAVAATIAIVKHNQAKAIDTTKEFAEELDKLRTNSESLNSELENLKTQLEDIGEKIKELESLPALSFVQEEELKRLRAVKDQLTLQQAVLQGQKEREDAQINKTQIEAANNWLDEDYYGWWQRLWHPDKRGTKKEFLDKAISAYSNASNDVEKYEDLLANVTDTTGEDTIRSYEKQLEAAKKRRDENEKIATDLIKELGNLIGTSTSGAGYDFYIQSMLKMNVATNVAGAKEQAIENIFAKDKLAELKQRIEELAESSDDATTEITELLRKSVELSGELQQFNSDDLNINDIVDYFTIGEQALDNSTLEGLTAQYAVAIKALEDLKSGATTVTDYITGSGEDLVVNEKNVAKVMKGASVDIRDEFTKLVTNIADGSMTIDNAIQYMTSKGTVASLDLLSEDLQAINEIQFKGIKDEIDGLIDTFTEFGAALKDVESAFTILNKAQTQMQHSGRLSVTTALDLINTTDRWNEILDVENGSIKLNGDYTKILIDDKLQLIKTNLELSLKTVKEQLAMINSKDATEDFTMTIEESTNAAVQQLAGSMAYLNTMMEAYARLASGDTEVNLDAARQAASDARDNTLEELAWTPTKETKTSKQELLKKQRDIQEQLKLLEGINTADEFKKYYDYDKTPGDKYDDGKSALDLLKAKYESLIDNLTNQQKWLQNEVDRLQAENKGVSRSYYEKQIELEEQKLHLYEQERAELQALLGTTAQGTDEYKDVASALWEVEFAIQDSVKAAIEFRKQIIDLYKTAFDKLKTLYGNQDEFLENQQTYIDKYNELQNALGKTGKREDIQRQLDIESEQVLYNQRLLDDLRKTRDDAMANGQMEAGSEEWIDMESNIRAVEMALLDGQLAVEKYKQALIDLYVNAFATLNEMFSNKNNFLNSQQGYITGYVDYLKELDIDAPSEAYKALIEIEEEKKKNNLDNLKEVKQNIADLENEFTAQGLSPDLYGTKKEWVDAVNKAIELEKALQDNDIAVAQWNKIINEMDFSKFDEFISRIGDLEKEIKRIVSVLYKNKEDIALEDGTWTSEGITVLGMYYHQMEVAKKKAAEYAQEIEELNEKYDAGSMSEKQYYERLQALKDGQWDAIDAYKEAKDSIVDLNAARIDMIEKGINEEIKAYNELLDLKKKELSAERDLYNFKKSTEEKTKSIAETQRKLAALSNSTSASDIAQSRKLQAELAKQQEDLNDSYYSHAMDSQQQALDDEGSLFEKTRNDYLEDLRKKLEEVDTIISESISDVLLNADVALNTLNEVSATYGVTLSDNLTNPWKEASIASTAWKEDISSALTSMINSDGVVTLFGNNAVASFGNVSTAINDMKLKADEFKSTTTDFETVGAAATTFSTNVTTGMQDILDQLNGKGKNGFTAEMTNGLKAPWDALNDKDSSLVTFSTKVAEQLDNAIDYAANNYASIMQGHLESPFDNASMSTFNENVKGALDKALADAREAADAINRTMDFNLPDYQGGIGGTGGTNGGGGSGSGGGTNTTGSKQSTMTKDDIMELQKFLKIYWDSSVVVDGIYGAGTKKAVQGMQRAINQFLQPVGGPYANDDGLYTQRTIDSLKAYYDLKDKTTGIKHIISVPKKAYYAKGTTGTSKSQWAITDEYGPELTMYATKEGNLSYMRAGSTVVPADITKKLLSMVDEYQPNLTFNQPGVPVLNNIVTNNSAINLHFDSFIKAEHITDATMPELNSLIDKKIDDFNRKINYALRRV